MTEAHDTLQALKDLPELVDKAWAIISADRKRQVELGILTPADAEILFQAIVARDEIGEAVSKARKDVPSPEIELPPEYLELKKQQKAVSEKYNQMNEIRRVLGQLKETSWGLHTIAGKLKLAGLAEQVLVPFKFSSDPITSDYFKLSQAIERKERVNTIVTRLRVKAWDEQHEAEVQAENRTREELEPKYRTLFIEEKGVLAKARLKTEELFAPIREEIRIVLEMADRICSLCGQGYTDDTGHNYDDCVNRCRDAVANLEGKLYLARKHLKEAKKIQGQDWWRKPKEAQNG